jgi:pantetheine-phosphate adenylyltransferase
MANIAVFPGSFDPFTIGHESIVKRAIPVFDKIVIAIGKNTTKQSFFTLENRLKMISDVFINESKVSVETYTGLTVDFCKNINSKYILRGLRNSTDFEYERSIALMNNLMHTEIETVFLLTQSEHTPVSSTIVREILKFDGDVSRFIPQNINIKNYL